MRVVLQRVSSAAVRVSDTIVGSIGTGLVALLGVTHEDTVDDARALAERVYYLRILREEQSLASSGAAALVVSQFTLYADTRKGRRPSWNAAAPAPVAEPLYDAFCSHLRDLGVPVSTGQFAADMAVELVNDGPVTLILDG
ncbi:MAG TPA: D-aminoacyl-tRNA deacylase [Aeromicrobium sp.]|nr:D-aminoacyl-tRNA deacylase [Aeromicrobium sp.]